jgi:CRP-like cAMP-binding protein
MLQTGYFLANRILGALPHVERERLMPHLKRVQLPRGMVVCESGDSLHHVYFPVECVVSLSYVLRDGGSTEVAVVGNDGVIGVAQIMGSAAAAPNRAVVQSAGSAYRLSAARFSEELDRRGDMLNLLLRYTQALIIQMAQTAVCNRHHTVDQQLCRRLLLLLDRVPSTTLPMTHELIANMLGVRREGVTLAAGRLQKLGAIRYFRGQLTVLDRSALEQLSCECYRVVKTAGDRLLPGVASQRRA